MGAFVRNLVSLGPAVLLVAIGLFHLQLLWSRLSDGSVLEPLVVVRWVASVAICAVFAALRRRGLSPFRGRAALILWLLVVLLHGVGLVPGAAAPALQAMPAAFLVAATPVGLAVATVFWVGAALLSRAASGPQSAGIGRRAASRRRRKPHSGRLALAGPRAPPF